MRLKSLQKLECKILFCIRGRELLERNTEDHLTEDAVNYYAQEIPLVIGHESLAHYVSKQLTRPTIVKIHRDLLFDPRNRTEEFEVLHDNWKKALGEIFAEYHASLGITLHEMGRYEETGEN